MILSLISIIVFLFYYNIDVSDDRYNAYCENNIKFYEDSVKRGEVISDQILSDNHNIRKLTIRINEDVMDLFIIQSPNDSPLLKNGDKFVKDRNSMILVLNNNERVKILSYCDRYFYTEIKSE